MDDANPDFAMILASSVHDMKNSLTMLLHSLEELTEELPGELKQSGKVATLQYEAERVNNDLIQLLGIYRLQQETLSVNIDEHFLRDFLEEQSARYEQLLNSRGIGVEIDCDEELAGYFDQVLVAGIINNVVTNAVRYARQRIRLAARQEDSELVIEVADDGTGYPASMLTQPVQADSGVDFDTGSTHLGLYFASRVAALHRQGEQLGRIHLENGGASGGGTFQLRLP